MTTFIYMFKPKRARLVDEASAEEEARPEEHMAYLQRALEEGMLFLAGPCPDGEFGVASYGPPLCKWRWSP